MLTVKLEIVFDCFFWSIPHKAYLIDHYLWLVFSFFPEVPLWFVYIPLIYIYIYIYISLMILHLPPALLVSFSWWAPDPDGHVSTLGYSKIIRSVRMSIQETLQMNSFQPFKTAEDLKKPLDEKFPFFSMCHCQKCVFFHVFPKTGMVIPPFRGVI